MATNTCTDCGCKKCGCADNALTTLPPCPTPAGCPNPIICSEIFDAQCVVYTGEPIICNAVTIVDTGDTMAEALASIVAAFCVAP